MLDACQVTKQPTRRSFHASASTATAARQGLDDHIEPESYQRRKDLGVSQTCDQAKVLTMHFGSKMLSSIGWVA